MNQRSQSLEYHWNLWNITRDNIRTKKISDSFVAKSQLNIKVCENNSLFNGILTFVDYLLLKLFLKKNNRDTI